jgi:hypothetical protein
MLDGSMTPTQRQASINHFMSDVNVECFLVSLKAGGVALNLTEASKVFIVDPYVYVSASTSCLSFKMNNIMASHLGHLDNSSEPPAMQHRLISNYSSGMDFLLTLKQLVESGS